MDLQLGLFFIHLVMIALVLNFIRFKLPNRFHHILFSLTVAYLYGLAVFFAPEWLFPFTLLVIFTITYFYQYIGLVIAFLLTMSVHIYLNGFNLDYLIVMIVLAPTIAYIINKSKTYFQIQTRWKSLLIKNSKQLKIIREISIAMQETRDLDKILHIIMTSVTAGHGLGFNRALVFLRDQEKEQLTGMMGIGPFNAKEGIDNWRGISDHKYRFTDLLEIADQKEIDPELNQIIKQMTIELDSDHILKDALVDGKHRLINSTVAHDQIHQLFIDVFNMEQFLIIPMIYQSTKIGLLILDNPVSKKPITEQEIDNVIPLASLASVAIQQAQLYQEVEQMTLKDGLTSLYNQRALQNNLQTHFNQDTVEPLAMIMLDIDSFKNYNDTNGHLFGNEVLEILANVIKQSIRESDLAFRFGGEEFSILLINTSVKEVATIAERIRKNIEQTVFPKEDCQPNNKLTITAGYAHTDQLKHPSPNRLTNAADQALYLGKRLGKNRICSFEE